jgi:hypothetical protein
MKKKTVFAFFLILFTLAACNQSNGLKNVQRETGTLDVSQIPGQSYYFIARKSDGSVWYVFSSGMTEGVGSVVCLIPPMFQTEKTETTPKPHDVSTMKF